MEIYFEYAGQTLCGEVRAKTCEGVIAVVGNTEYWVVAPYFSSLPDLLAYKAGAYFTPQ